MSDWGATHSTINAANNGLDMEMPDDYWFGKRLREAITDGKVSVDRLNDMNVRILTSLFAVGLFDIPQPTGNLSVNAQSAEHVRLARELAEAGTVLLKNSAGLLPIYPLGLKNIAVIGDDANSSPFYAGYGSGHVNPPYVITPLQGIQNYVGDEVNVQFASNSSIPNAVALARASDIAIVFAGLTTSEGTDRSNLYMPGNQDATIAAVAAAQPNTIVVLHIAGPVLMPWVNAVSAIVCAFMPGQEDGNAIARILFGATNPSGKLPLTFPPSESEVPANLVIEYPGVDNEAYYFEALFVGYRWYDAKNVEPLFPFGHGLSYTTFLYRNLSISTISNSNTAANVTFIVENVGRITGRETPQLYVGFPASALEPPKLLKGFTKIELGPGEQRLVALPLQVRDVSVWSVENHQWQEVFGSFQVYVGSSSRDIRLTGSFNNSQ